MFITIKEVDMAYCDDMADILSSDTKLHLSLSPNSPHKMITAKEYYDGCKAWELRKEGRNYVILNENKPIGSISYSKKDSLTASCGYWIKSDLWGLGYAREAFSKFLAIIKNAGYEYVTASIKKNNNASWRLWAKYTSDIKEDEYRYTPLIKLS